MNIHRTVHVNSALSALLVTCEFQTTLRNHDYIIVERASIEYIHRYGSFRSLTIFLFSSHFQVVRKYGYAYNQSDFPYKIQNVLECEFYLLEMLVSNIV